MKLYSEQSDFLIKRVKSFCFFFLFSWKRFKEKESDVIGGILLESSNFFDLCPLPWTNSLTLCRSFNDNVGLELKKKKRLLV